MILFLRFFFIVVLLSMLSITGWATSEVALWKTPEAVATHPWFLATLLDAYWGFLTFYCWVFYKETSWIGKLGWFIGILLLGNIAMAVYMLIQLFRVPVTARIEEVLLRNSKF